MRGLPPAMSRLCPKRTAAPPEVALVSGSDKVTKARAGQAARERAASCSPASRDQGIDPRREQRSPCLAASDYGLRRARCDALVSGRRKALEAAAKTVEDRGGNCTGNRKPFRRKHLPAGRRCGPGVRQEGLGEARRRATNRGTQAAAVAGHCGGFLIALPPGDWARLTSGIPILATPASRPIAQAYRREGLVLEPNVQSR